MTRAQIQEHQTNNPCIALDAAQIINKVQTPEDVARWLVEADGIPLAYSSADPSAVAEAQQIYGRARTADALEQFFTNVARLVVDMGVTRLLSAGGETSGAIVEGLELNQLEIGPEIAPGVPALRARPDLTLALKSGNFGQLDYFARAAQVLKGTL